jgi:hypothetical protein
MIKIENTKVMGFEEVTRRLGAPMNITHVSDSGICKGGDDGIKCCDCAHYDCEHSYDHSFQIGKQDYALMLDLINRGRSYSKFRRMITVYADITASLYWWAEFDSYKAESNVAPLQILPSSYNQTRTVMLNYEILSDIYYACKYQKLDEWREFWRWIDGLPYVGEMATNKSLVQ